MKTIDIKSLMIGAVAALTIIVLASSRPNDASQIEFVPYSGGMGIYNQQSKTIYLYSMGSLGVGGIKETPDRIFKVEDGSSLTKIK